MQGTHWPVGTGRGEEKAVTAATAIHRIHPAQPDSPAKARQGNPKSQVDEAGSMHVNSEPDTANKVESTGNVTEKSNTGTSYRNCFLF